MKQKESKAEKKTTSVKPKVSKSKASKKEAIEVNRVRPEDESDEDLNIRCLGSLNAKEGTGKKASIMSLMSDDIERAVNPIS